jgi:hypothetical protein
MRVTARGWSKDHGPKELLSSELSYAEINEGVDKFSDDKTYFQIARNVRERLRGRRRVDYTVRISAHAKLNLNGSYLVQLELDRTEIARLFYETNGDQGLPELLKLFSEFKDQNELGFVRHETA